MRQSSNEDYLPWQHLMEISFGVLGLAPQAFWSMTPVEWAAAFQGWQKRNGMTGPWWRSH